LASTINAKNTSTGVVITPDSSGQLELQTADTTRMTIDVNGNVGVGTSSPVQRLTVESTSNVRATIRNSTENTSYASSLDFATGSGSLASANMVGRVIGLVTQADPSPLQSALTFHTNSGDNLAERMRIDSSGNLLVGTTASAYGYQANSFRWSGNTVYCSVNQTTYRNQIIFFNPNGEVGQISTTGSATSYGTSSDYRLKENIAPMTGALETVAQLKPVTYTWKVDGSDGQGFIAHELQEVVPDCVIGEKDAVDEEGNPRYQGIDTSFLVATLTAAIQEQQAIINDLKARIETLEGASA
jgi:hypothetical protein